MKVLRWMVLPIVLCTYTGAKAQGGWFFSQLLLESIGSWDEGGVDLKFTSIGNHPTNLYGFHGGWLVSDNCLIGYAGYLSGGSFTETPGINYEVDMSYGGLYLEFRRPLNDRVSFNFPVLIGGGASWATGTDIPPGERYRSGFFAFEPGASVSIKLLPFMRLEASGTYRIALGSQTFGASDAKLSAPAVGVALMFGNFRD